ncbi:MAG: hypothetical protein WC802_05175 [Patescibacteria group bacterium]|jgi:hypothetical protein
MLRSKNGALNNRRKLSNLTPGGFVGFILPEEVLMGVTTFGNRYSFDTVKACAKADEMAEMLYRWSRGGREEFRLCRDLTVATHLMLPMFSWNRDERPYGQKDPAKVQFHVVQIEAREMEVTLVAMRSGTLRPSEWHSMEAPEAVRVLVGSVIVVTADGNEDQKRRKEVHFFHAHDETASIHDQSSNHPRVPTHLSVRERDSALFILVRPNFQQEYGRWSV